MHRIDRCPTKIRRFVFILFVVKLCAMDQIFYMDYHVIQGVTLAASLDRGLYQTDHSKRAWLFLVIQVHTSSSSEVADHCSAHS